MPQKDASINSVLHSWINRLRDWNVVIGIASDKTSSTVDYRLADLDVDSHHSSASTKSPSDVPNVHPIFLVMGDLNMELERGPEQTSQWKKVSVRGLLDTILAAISLQFLSLSMISSPPPTTRGKAILDYICLPTAWSPFIHSMNVLPSSLSDHSMVLVTVILDKAHLHAPYWRFKNDLLSCNSYLRSMQLFIQMRLFNIPTNPISFFNWWDLLKADIVKKSKQCWLRLLRTKRFHSFHAGLAQSNMRRGELSYNKIRFLKADDNKIISDNNQIFKTLGNYYAHLYHSDSSVMVPDVSMTFGLSVIPDHVCEVASQPITLEDLHTAATSMNLSKAPGQDGISLEFYIAFWNLLGPIILLWFEHTLSLGKLHGSAALGIITLVSKPGDARLLSNWRPITLLTVELKIVLKAIANKLLPVISSILPQHQNAIPGKSIFTSLSIVRDIISIHNSSKRTLWLLSLDLEKAFDKVNHSFLFHLLDVIGLPVILKNSIKAMYSGFSCTIKNADSLSDQFPYSRGIRQGDPTSTLLFSLALQPLLNALCLTLRDKGVLLPKADRIILSAYADDITLFINNLDSVANILETCDFMAKFSEATINIKKSKVFGLNVPCAQKDFFQNSIPIPISYESINILGITFSSTATIHKTQWNYKMSSTLKMINCNYSYLSTLSYIQRAIWAKKRLWPRWAHLLKVLQPSKVQLNQLSDILSEAIWLGSKHILSVKDIACNIRNGGLNALRPLDRIMTFRVIMLARLYMMKTSDHQFQLARHICNQYAFLELGFAIFHSSPEEELLSSLPSVYASAFHAWSLLPTAFFPLSKEDILNMPAVSSKFLLEAEEPLFIKSSLAKAMNFRTIRDLYYCQPRATRLSCFLNKSVRNAVDAWFLPPWPDGLQLQDVADDFVPNTGLVGFPRFFLHVNDSLLSIEKWSNNSISKIFSSKANTQLTPVVPADTWKILASVTAPSAFVNQTWKILHRHMPSPAFYFHLGMINSLACLFCSSLDVSFVHQFSTCHVLRMVIDRLNIFIYKIGVPPLADLNQLYPLPSVEHRLANFLVLSYFYTVALITRSIANSLNKIISPKKIHDIFISVISRHLRYHALRYPPSDLQMRHNWDIYTYNKVIAYFDNVTLFVLDQQGFRPCKDTLN